jgi:hypothetical protein
MAYMGKNIRDANVTGPIPLSVQWFSSNMFSLSSGIGFAALVCAVIAAVWLMLIQDKVGPFVRTVLPHLGHGSEQVAVAQTKPDWGLRPFVTWGLAVLLFGSAMTLASSQFEIARILFALGAIPLVVGFAFGGSASLYSRFLIAVFGSLVIAVGINRINDWVLTLELEQIAKDARGDLRDVQSRYQSPTKSHPPLSRGKPCKISPNAGTGADNYKHVCDLDVAQWTIDEAQQLEDAAREVSNRTSQVRNSAGVESFLFERLLKPLGDDLKALRGEVLARLGPNAKDSQEIYRWGKLFPDADIPPPLSHVSPSDGMAYSPYLRKLGVHLKRTVVKRLASMLMNAKVQPSTDATLPGAYAEEIIVTPSSPMVAGYVLVSFAHEGLYSITTALKGGHVIEPNEVMDNGDAREKCTVSATTVCVRIGSIPLSRDNPMRVLVQRKAPNSRPVTAIWFDE